MIGRRLFSAAALFLGVLLASSSAKAQTAAVPAESTSSVPVTPANQDQLVKVTEAFVRDLYAWGPDFAVKIGPFSQSPAPDYYRVGLEVTYKGQSDKGDLYVSKDGKTVLRGDVFATDKNPFEAVRAHLNAEGNPSTGPANAPITLVEFADFECPHCKEFSDNFAAIQQKFPQIRLVYKDYPLNDIHPWAETAAIAGRCAFLQSPAAFWKMHDEIFKQQDSITPDNAWDQLNGFAKDEGLDTEAFKTCMASPSAKNAVAANHNDALTLGVNSTPTVYVNGRPVIGGDPATVEQYIQYELNGHSK